MNERIRKITGQVLDELVPQTWTTLGYDQIKEIQHRTAELIVQECADICMEMSAKCAGFEHDGALARDCADYIKKDFGVA